MRSVRRSDRPYDPHGDAGAVTVEAAMALGTLVLTTALAVAAVAAVSAGVRCSDAARELVRHAARGDADRGRTAAAALAPSGATTELRFDGELVVATVTAHPAGPLPVGIGGSATAVAEPGLTAAGTAAPSGGAAAAAGGVAGPGSVAGPDSVAGPNDGGDGGDAGEAPGGDLPDALTAPAPAAAVPGPGPSPGPGPGPGGDGPP
ncbi:TadE family type IV pilus minor pilin [Pseudonocardia phyllosphaerae]|uniref:TadE family type IV pilus minor pilin n=1 Tax=Pseudonocardia phyllosphaerae TaxID=3390502 RepID=UPI0039787B1B